VAGHRPVPDAAELADQLRGAPPETLSRLLILANRAVLSRDLARGVAHGLANALQVTALRGDFPQYADSATGHAADQVWVWLEARLGVAARVLCRLGRFDESAQGPTALGELIPEVDEWQAMLPGARTVSFELRAGTGLPVVGLGPGQLLQAVLALVVNAREAVLERRGGRVILEASAEGDAALIRVEDSGAGIAAGIRDQVATPFFTTKDPAKHLGIGLSVARIIVESVGGALLIEDSPGGGACVCLRIPESLPERSAR